MPTALRLLDPVGRSFVMGPDILTEGERLVRAAADRGLRMRLLGGTAVLWHCASARAGPVARAGAPDLDFAGLAREAPALRRLFEAEGYEPNRNFNALHGYKRLMFAGPDGGPKVDVFLDRFSMCHDLDLRPRVELGTVTLPLADLVFTKLQVVQINPKDLRDLACLFLDHAVEEAEAPEVIDAGYLARRGAEDWGTYTTLTDNLEKLAAFVGETGLASDDGARVRERSARLRSRMDAEPKGFGWRMRARVGRRMEWYEVPDEPKAIRLGPAE